MNKFVSFLMVVFMLMIPTMGMATSLTLSNGQTIELDGLSDVEKSNMLKYIEKIDKQKDSAQSGIINKLPTDVDELHKWSKLVTGTIKDVCNDLSITVNEFVKTPVGIGVAGLITYKVMGKDLLEKVFDIVFAIPMWFTITGILGLLTRHFFGMVTIHNEEIIDGKVVKTNGQRVKKYDFKSGDSRAIMAAFLMVCFVAITWVTLVIIF